MKLAEAHVARLEGFLNRIAGETYPEEPSELHDQITEAVMARAFDLWTLPAGARVLDVGCGQGVALKRFTARGLATTGITLNEVDVAACVQQGYNVLHMDQSFLDFPDASFDLVWCRHCLEHSVFPFFTLTQFARVLQPGGRLYLEVPAPDTSCRHQTNGNHYSVLGKSMLESLVQRSGFQIRDTTNVEFATRAGPDLYWGIYAERT